jgi:predicted PurR-regulated permease PerM
VLGAIVLGALLAFLIGPIVDRIQLVGVPRVLGILLCFAVLIALLTVLVSLFVPVFTSEARQLNQQAPGIAAEAQRRLGALVQKPLQVGGYRLDLRGSVDTLETHARDFLAGQFGNALGLGIAAISTALQLVLLFIVAFLVALDAHRLARFMRSFVPGDYRQDFDEVWSEIKFMLYAYLRGQLIIAGMIGVASGVTVALLGVPFAFALGVLAAVTSLVPYLGPILGALPAVLIALSVSPVKAVVVAIAYVVISNVILNFVYPKVVGSAVKLPALAVILSFIAGFSLAGILGMFVAVPLAACIRILYEHIHPRLYPALE